MNLQCPRCGKETVFENNPSRPFCSERCRLIDLGNWISGTYSIPAENEEAEETEVSDEKIEEQ